MIRNNFLRIFFLPIYFTFKILVWLKNKLYDSLIIKSFSPEIFTINIGNLAVGGTGKTPMVEYLASHFLKNNKIAILSRGYGRKTKGFFQLNNSSNALLVGDEPMQYFQKFNSKLNIFVCENRVEGYKKVMELAPNTNLLLLDDAYQHRAIAAHVNIILTDYNNLIYNDLMLPFGKLREPIESLLRANILVITKCPEYLAEGEASQIKLNFLKYCKPTIHVFFSKIVYLNPIQFSGENIELPKDIILVAGIANAGAIVKYCENNWGIKHKFLFADHHNYTLADLKNIEQFSTKNTAIITTEKDFVKLNGRFSANIKAFYLPISTEFLFEKIEYFLEILKTQMNTFYQKS